MVKFGRKPKLTPGQIDHARKLIEAGESRQHVADLLSVGREGSGERACYKSDPQHPPALGLQDVAASVQRVVHALDELRDVHRALRVLERRAGARWLAAKCDSDPEPEKP